MLPMPPPKNPEEGRGRLVSRCSWLGCGIGRRCGRHIGRGGWLRAHRCCRRRIAPGVAIEKARGPRTTRCIGLQGLHLVLQGRHLRLGGVQGLLHQQGALHQQVGSIGLLGHGGLDHGVGLGILADAPHLGQLLEEILKGLGFLRTHDDAPDKVEKSKTIKTRESRLKRRL
jgi:hypothetical protein